MKKILFLFILFLVLIISGCGYGYPIYDNPHKIYIDDVLVYNESGKNLETVYIEENYLESFINYVDLSRKSLSTPTPTFQYFHGFSITDEKRLLIEFRCRTRNDEVIKSFNLSMEKFNGGRDFIFSKSIEKVDNYYIIKFEINNLPNISAELVIIDPYVVDINNNTFEALVTDSKGSKYTTYFGLALRVEKSYLQYKEEIEHLNANLKSNFKMYDKVPQVIDIISDFEESDIFGSVNGYSNFYGFYNRQLYKMDRTKLPNNYDYSQYYLFDKCCIYVLNDRYHNYYSNESDCLLYIRGLQISDSAYEVFGVSVDNTIEEIQESFLSEQLIENIITRYNLYNLYIYKSINESYQIKVTVEKESNVVRGIYILCNDIYEV